MVVRWCDGSGAVSCCVMCDGGVMARDARLSKIAAQSQPMVSISDILSVLSLDQRFKIGAREVEQAGQS